MAGGLNATGNSPSNAPDKTNLFYITERLQWEKNNTHTLQISCVCKVPVFD